MLLYEKWLISLLWDNRYGGPTSQMVDQHYQSNFPHAMAAAGFIYVVVDGRGTGFKGRVCSFFN